MSRRPFLFCVGDLLLVEQFRDFVDERADVLELTVDRRKADIGDFVDVLEFFHGELADLPGGDFLFEGVLEGGLDVGDGFFDGLDRDRTFLTGAQQAVEQLDAVETLAGAVFLDDDQRDGLDDLIRGEALAALRAFTATTDAFAFVGGAGIDNFAVFTTAVRAFHMCSPSKTVQNTR